MHHYTQLNLFLKKISPPVNNSTPKIYTTPRTLPFLLYANITEFQKIHLHLFVKSERPLMVLCHPLSIDRSSDLSLSEQRKMLDKHPCTMVGLLSP